MAEQQVRDRGRVALARDGRQADAAAHLHAMRSELERHLHRVDHALGERHQVIKVVLEKHGELIAAEPGHGVTATQAGTQPLAARPGGVAARQAEPVVDRLETVEVEVEKGQVTVLALPGRGVLEPVLENSRLASPVSGSWKAR